MVNGSVIALTCVFVGVFAVAFAHELVQTTELFQKASGKMSEGLELARQAFREGYSAGKAPAPDGSS